MSKPFTAKECLYMAEQLAEVMGSVKIVNFAHLKGVEHAHSMMAQTAAEHIEGIIKERDYSRDVVELDVHHRCVSIDTPSFVLEGLYERPNNYQPVNQIIIRYGRTIESHRSIRDRRKNYNPRLFNGKMYVTWHYNNNGGTFDRVLMYNDRNHIDCHKAYFVQKKDYEKYYINT